MHSTRSSPSSQVIALEVLGRFRNGFIYFSKGVLKEKIKDAILTHPYMLSALECGV